jgi:exopolysaccharide production protein ExoQ
MLGVGYQAFWVQGHVEAEGLWRFAQIESRVGFHFHNLYYETAVELGEFGVVILAVSLGAAAAAALRLSVTRPGSDTAFLCSLVVFYAIRVGVELDFLDPFSPGSLLLPIVWIYSGFGITQQYRMSAKPVRLAGARQTWAAAYFGFEVDHDTSSG